MEYEFPFKLTPEQKSILLLWYGADSKFGWTKLDFLVGIQRVRRHYPDHRDSLSKSYDGLEEESFIDFSFDYPGYDNPVIRFNQDYDLDDLPF